MYFQLCDKEKFTKKQRILYPTIILVIFYGAVITLIALINPFARFCFDYILWMFFSGASIVPVIYLILLILAYGF